MNDLREALAESEHHYLTQDMKVIVAAARRFLALTETGPDYEAAAKVLYNSKPEVVSGSWPRWEDLRSAARALHLDNAKAVVDAALADYPVSTEGET